MNLRKSTSTALIGVAVIAAGMNAWDILTDNPDPGFTNLDAIGNIGVLLNDTTLTRAWLSDGSLAIDGADSLKYDLVVLNQTPDETHYEFFVESNVGQSDTFLVKRDESLTLSVADTVAADQAVRWTIRAQEWNWPWQSGPFVVELSPCVGTVDCRVEQRSMASVPPYLVVTDWGGQDGQAWDVVNQSDGSTTIVTPPDQEFVFRWRALDPRFGLWRGVSPPVTVQTRICDPDTVVIDPPDTTAVEGPRLASATWQSGWSLRFDFADPGSIYEPSVEAGDYKLVRPDSTEFRPTGTPILRNDSYFTVYCDGCASTGQWTMILDAGAVADTNGVFNALPDTVVWDY